LDGFDVLRKIAKFATVSNLPWIGTVAGSITEGNAAVLLSTRSVLTDTYNLGRDVRASYEVYISTAIHEMAHLAGKEFSDHILAFAGKELGETKRTVGTNVLDKRSEDASFTVSEIINKNCGEDGVRR
jgi:hypothetical protein